MLAALHAISRIAPYRTASVEPSVVSHIGYQDSAFRFKQNRVW